MKTAFQARGEPRSFRDIIDRLCVSHGHNEDGTVHPVNASVRKPEYRIEEKWLWDASTSGDGVWLKYHRWVTLIVYDEAKVGWRDVGRLYTPYDDEVGPDDTPMERKEMWEANSIYFEQDVDLKTANYVCRMLDWDWRNDDG